MDEFNRAVADHFLRRVSQDGFGAGAHLDEDALRICDQDQILGGFKDTPPLFDLLAERLLGSLAFGNVAGGFGCADDRSQRRLDGRYAEGHLHRTAVPAQSHCFVVFDTLAPADPVQDVVHLGCPIGGHD
jgi:hypothetical protein